MTYSRKVVEYAHSNMSDPTSDPFSLTKPRETAPNATYPTSSGFSTELVGSGSVEVGRTINNFQTRRLPSTEDQTGTVEELIGEIQAFLKQAAARQGPPVPIEELIPGQNLETNTVSYRGQSDAGELNLSARIIKRKFQQK